jgi:hypothetical protein
MTRNNRVNKETRLTQKEMAMKSRKRGVLYSLLSLAGMLAGISAAHAADTVVKSTVPVSMTVTASVPGDKRMPDLSQDDILVKQGKERLQVTNLIAARGENAGLELFILIDDSVDSRIGLQFDELRSFIEDQPPTTLIGVGYMRNATVEIAQDFTSDHTRAANALRLPLGHYGSFGSPYLSVVDLMKRWPDSNNRREVLMLTDGVDRARRNIGWHRGLNSYPDAERASAAAQKTGTMIHTIYFPSSSRLRHNYWEATNGQMNSARLADSTGGESYFLGLHGPVSFRPYLEALQRTLNNQYRVSFSAPQGKKARLQNVTLSTEVAGVELTTHDGVWVPAAK